MYALTPGKGLLTHREAGGILNLYAQLTRSAEWFAEPGVAARVAAEFEGWAPELITDRETPPTVRILHTLPDGHR